MGTVNVRKIVELCWTNEQDILRAITAKRQDTTTTAGGGGHCRISDPTAQRAIANLSDVDCITLDYGPCINGKHSNTICIHKPLQWLKVARWTRERYAGTMQGRIIQYKYNESMTIRDIVKALEISQATYYPAIADIFVFAEGLAMGLGLIAHNRH